MINIKKDVFSISDKGLVRQENEDNCGFAETPNGCLFVVCDGMGGHVGGKTASKIAVDSIINYFVSNIYSNIQIALANALNVANRQIIATAQANPELKGMGTTACVVLIKDNKAWFAWAGDSRIYLFCNQQQWLHRITKDHSFVQGLVDQGVISDAEAEHHPNKNRILKALGIKEDLQPEICQAPVFPAKNDIFLICSDGLSGMVTDDDMQHVLLQNSSLEEKGNLLITLAKQAGGNDNITVQLIRISQSPYSSSVFESKNPAERIYMPKSSSTSETPKITSNTKKSNGVLKYALIASVALLLGIGGFWLGKGDKNENVGETTLISNDNINDTENISDINDLSEINDEIPEQSNFFIRISQVYPKGDDKDFHYDLRHEWEAAEKKFLNQYDEKEPKANYKIILAEIGEKPRGKVILNIKWILDTNGKEEYYKSEPKLKDSYAEVTTIKKYKFEIDGITKKEVFSNSYNHYCKFYKGGDEQAIGKSYRPFSECETWAQNYLPKTDNVLYEVKILNEQNTEVKSINNKVDFEKHQREMQKNKTTPIENNIVKKPNDECNTETLKGLPDISGHDRAKKFDAIMKCINTNSTDPKDINENLELCEIAVLHKEVIDVNRRKTVIDKLNKILDQMKKNDKNNDKLNKFKNNHFKDKDIDYIKKGIIALKDINKELIN